ncbi:MAG: hypothetical protein JXR53_08910 [Bacteroidales bacterium]|nr:hypothetical protein [Bacteroidales bacterium]
MYVFENTERFAKKANDFEAKSLLYLLGSHPDKVAIQTCTIDCFNDVTGINEDRLWDLQSKNYSTITPKMIGGFLITLYKNFVSDFDFEDFILFVPTIEQKRLEEGAVPPYSYSDFTMESKDKINEGLESEIKTKGLSPEKLKEFLGKIRIVTDNRKIASYVKSVCSFRRKTVVGNESYERIFKEIRDKQTALKNSEIEGIKIEKPSDVLQLGRHISRADIETLIITRLVGGELFKNRGIPPEFHSETRGMDVDGIRDVIQECNSNLAKAFFDKNKSKTAWKVFEVLLEALQLGKNPTIDEALEKVMEINGIPNTILNERTIKYLASIMKEGLHED